MQSNISAIIQSQAYNPGSGDGGAGITNTIDNATNWLAIAGGSIAGLAFMIAVVIVIMTVKGGGNLQTAFGRLGLPLAGAFLLGIGAVLVQWVMGLGSSLAS